MPMTHSTCASSASAWASLYQLQSTTSLVEAPSARNAYEGIDGNRMRAAADRVKDQTARSALTTEVNQGRVECAQRGKQVRPFDRPSLVELEASSVDAAAQCLVDS